MRKKTKLVCGVGINDAEFKTESIIDGKRRVIPSYRCWASMLDRCYSPKLQAKRKTYVGCYVCDEWLTYSNFHKWHASQATTNGYHLDKDTLFPGNKVYSPETCILVPPMVNSFTTDSGASRGAFMIGCSLHKGSGKYQATCSNPFTRKVEHLGQFSSEIEAHMAWKKRKHEIACQIAETVHDERLAEALRKRYI